MSSLIPSAPWIWIARSTTCCMTPATWNLTSEMASRAASMPWASIVQAACRTRSRAASISAQALGDPVLHGLPAAERVARRELPRGRPVAHQVEGAAADADPAHRVVDSARAQPGLRHGEPGPLLAEPVLDRHPAPSNASSAWLAQSSPACPMHEMFRTRRKPGVVGRHDDQAGAAVGLGVGVGHGHDDGEAAPSAAEANHLRPSMT